MTWKETHTEGGHCVKMEAEVKAMLLHPKQPQELPADLQKLGEPGQTLPLASRRNLLPTPQPWPPSSRAAPSSCLSSPVSSPHPEYQQLTQQRGEFLCVW